VYDEPANTYVADFLGLANLLPATADADGVVVLGERVAATTGDTSGNCYVVLRPERLRLVAPEQSPLRAHVDHVVFAGALTHVHLSVQVESGTHALQAMVANGGGGPDLHDGAEVGLVLEPSALRVLPN
jgi:putative spermidine/putrescine transport system ATP-binding protein